MKKDRRATRIVFFDGVPGNPIPKMNWVVNDNWPFSPEELRMPASRDVFLNAFSPIQSEILASRLRSIRIKYPERPFSGWTGLPQVFCLLFFLKVVNYDTRLLTKIGIMKKVADIFAHKGRKITSVSPGTTVLEALKIMADQNMGSVIVLDDQRYLGIMTERDYSRKVILKGKSSTDTKVTEIMSEDLPWVNPSDSVEYCMQLMADKNIRYLPVFENDKLVGIVSINDLVRETILTQQETISQLKDYLHASM
ncbi:MAG TPA: CBS domain-containing protein [Puia sp.]|jgi:CBS domain-containing protein|nr:CBS domain-containing protein [Puia sp.]